MYLGIKNHYVCDLLSEKNILAYERHGGREGGAMTVQMWADVNIGEIWMKEYKQLRFL